MKSFAGAGALLCLFLAPVACSTAAPEEPLGERLGETSQALTSCVTFQRGTRGDVADATISKAALKKNFGREGTLRVDKKDDPARFMTARHHHETDMSGFHRAANEVDRVDAIEGKIDDHDGVAPGGKLGLRRTHHLGSDDDVTRTREQRGEALSPIPLGGDDEGARVQGHPVIVSPAQDPPISWEPRRR